MITHRLSSTMAAMRIDLYENGGIKEQSDEYSQSVKVIDFRCRFRNI